MKIPEYQPMQVAPEGVKLPVREAPRQDYGGVAGLGKEVGQGLEQVQGAYEGYRHQQRVKQANDADTEYTRAETEVMHGAASGSGPDISPATLDSEGDQHVVIDMAGAQPKRTPGFLDTIGDNALPAFDPAMKDLQKRRQDIAEKMEDPEARKMFLAQTAPRYEATYRQAEGHLAGQIRVGQVDSVKNGLAAITNAVSMDPLNGDKAIALVAGQAGRAAALASSKEDADAQVEAIRAHVATARAQVLIKQAEDNPALYGAAEKVVKGSEAALGPKAAVLLDQIHDGRAGAQVQSTAANIMNASRSDNVFNPVDIGKVEAELAKVPPEQRKKVSDAVDDMVGRDARRVKAEKDKFIDAAQSQYIEQRGKFFDSTTAKVLKVVDPPTYFALEDRLKNASRAARAEGREQLLLQSKLDSMALDDLRTRLTEDPSKVDIQRFFGEHPELSGGKINEANRLKAAADKVYAAGLKPSLERFTADYMAEVSKKMPAFTGTRAEVHDQQSAWKAKQRADAIDAYTDEMDANKGEKPSPDVLNRRKADAYLSLPVPNPESNPKALASDVKAIIDLATPAPAAQPQPGAVRSTGRTVTMPNGDVYAEMTSGPPRLLVPGKKKAKK